MSGSCSWLSVEWASAFSFHGARRDHVNIRSQRNNSSVNDRRARGDKLEYSNEDKPSLLLPVKK